MGHQCEKTREKTPFHMAARTMVLRMESLESRTPLAADTVAAEETFHPSEYDTAISDLMFECMPYEWTTAMPVDGTGLEIPVDVCVPLEEPVQADLMFCGMPFDGTDVVEQTLSCEGDGADDPLIFASVPPSDSVEGAWPEGEPIYFVTTGEAGDPDEGDGIPEVIWEPETPFIAYSSVVPGDDATSPEAVPIVPAAAEPLPTPRVWAAYPTTRNPFATLAFTAQAGFASSGGDTSDDGFLGTRRRARRN